jgi:hypothetical protein
VPAPRNTEVEKALNDRGVSYELMEIDVGLIDVVRSQANQARIQSPLVQSVVETYIAAMTRGDEFPPLIVYKARGAELKYVIVDGNHRLAAATGANLKSIWAYVVADNTPSELITILTYEANTKHGLPTSEVERARHAVFLIENAGETIKNAAARMNLSPAFLTRHYTGVRANNRAGAAGINQGRWFDLSLAVRTRLNTLKADETFGACITYALKARLNATEIEELVTRLNKEGSVTEQLTILQREEQSNQGRIQDVAMGKDKARQSSMAGPRRSLYNATGMIESLTGDKQLRLIRDFTPLEASEWTSRIAQMRTTLQEIEDELQKKAKSQ